MIEPSMVLVINPEETKIVQWIVRSMRLKFESPQRVSVLKISVPSRGKSFLGQQAAQILDYKNFGLFFIYDLLGYAFMALAAFFIAFTIRAVSKPDKWPKALLRITFIFAF